MSSLKKHAFTATLPAIALQDFTPNAELFQYDLSASALLPNLQPSRSRLNTYVITHTLGLFSKPSSSARQEMPKDPDSAPNNPVSYTHLTMPTTSRV